MPHSASLSPAKEAVQISLAAACRSCCAAAACQAGCISSTPRCSQAHATPNLRKLSCGTKLYQRHRVPYCAHLARKLFKSTWPLVAPAALLPPAKLSASLSSTIAGIHSYD
jgi:hypothetical protein